MFRLLSDEPWQKLRSFGTFRLASKSLPIGRTDPATTAGVFWIQRRKSGDSFGAALAKAILGGVLAGLPTPISGTIFGTLVLVLSGLSSWNQRK